MKKELAVIVEQILAMREYSRTSGFKSHKSQNTLLAGLVPADLGEVLVELKRREQGTKDGTNDISK